MNKLELQNKAIEVFGVEPEQVTDVMYFFVKKWYFDGSNLLDLFGEEYSTEYKLITGKGYLLDIDYTFIVERLRSAGVLNSLDEVVYRNMETKTDLKLVEKDLQCVDVSGMDS